VVYRGEILFDTGGDKVRGKWDAILTEDEYSDVVAKWGASEQPVPSRLGAKGRGYRTIYLLSPFVRCGKCSARMIGSRRRNRRGELEEFYRCPAKGAGGCGSVTRIADPVNTYIKALVIAEQQTIQFRKLEDLPPWPKAQELADLQQRIEESQRQYEKGTISAQRHFPSLTRMEADEAKLLREKRRHDGRPQTRRHAIANLAEEWDKPDFTMEQKQAAIGETLTAVIIKAAGKGGRFHPDQIVPVFRESEAAA
jgi:site-specific DNA recombinase